MDAKIKDRLLRYTLAAKKLIYTPQATTALVEMMSSRDGAIKAVATVLQGIQMHIPIPPALKPLLSGMVYMLLVDIAQQVTGGKANPQAVKDTINALLGQVNSAAQQEMARGKQQPAAQGVAA